jgi:hypothetical protein
MPQRPMLLFSGSLSAATTSFGDLRHLGPSLWWPQDRAWCVATDVDLMSTYIGSTEVCVDALVNDQDLEAMTVSVDQGVSYDSDTINPTPRR